MPSPRPAHARLAPSGTDVAATVARAFALDGCRCFLVDEDEQANRALSVADWAFRQSTPWWITGRSVPSRRCRKCSTNLRAAGDTEPFSFGEVK
jgi:hypothetical protein